MSFQEFQIEPVCSRLASSAWDYTTLIQQSKSVKQRPTKEEKKKKKVVKQYRADHNVEHDI